MPFERGVSYYTKAQAVITIGFPEDKTVCEYCKLCVQDPFNRSREVCIVTSEILYNPKTSVGNQCPLMEVEE